MQEFIAKYKDEIQGWLSGFDRLVFVGALHELDFCQWEPEMQALRATAMEQYLWHNDIKFMDYAGYVKRVSQQIKKAAVEPFHQAELPVIHLDSPEVDKDATARQIARERGIQEGLVCTLGSVEMHASFEHRRTIMVRRKRPCHVLYQYQIHPQVGWMYARIRTWFPFRIQVGLNGREWLAQQMRREKLKFRQADNCFVWIEDFARAQALLEQQVQTHWAELLGGLARQLNPLHESIFANYPMHYYWTCEQSEWASDVVFRKAEFLRRLMPRLVRHGMLSFHSADVMRFLGKQVNQSGLFRKNFHGDLQMDLKRRQEGERVKFYVNGNSAKFYDKAYSDYGSVLRAGEATLNHVRDLKAYRPKQGGPEDDLAWRELRKGIADLHRRTEISQGINNRLIDALARVDDSRTVEELTRTIQQPVQWKGRRVRALQPWGTDHALLSASTCAVSSDCDVGGGGAGRLLSSLHAATNPTDNPATPSRSNLDFIDIPLVVGAGGRTGERRVQIRKRRQVIGRVRLGAIGILQLARRIRRRVGIRCAAIEGRQQHAHGHPQLNVHDIVDR